MQEETGLQLKEMHGGGRVPGVEEAIVGRCGGGRWQCRGSRTAAPGGAAAVSHGSSSFAWFVAFVLVS